MYSLATEQTIFILSRLPELKQNLGLVTDKSLIWVLFVSRLPKTRQNLGLVTDRSCWRRILRCGQDEEGARYALSSSEIVSPGQAGSELDLMKWVADDSGTDVEPAPAQSGSNRADRTEAVLVFHILAE